MPAMPARTVIIVAFPGVQSLDVTGPLEVFHTAARIAGGGYDVRVATLDGDTVVASSGLRLAGDLALADVGAIDTLIVAGGDGTAAMRATRGWSTGCASARRGARRVALGVLRRVPAGRGGPARRPPRDHALGACAASSPTATRGGRRPRPDLHARRRPVDLGRRHRRHGPRAGARRGGPRPRGRARDRPRWLVLFLRRPGGQTQFSAQLAAQVAEREPIRELQQWIADHPDERPLGRGPRRARRDEPAPLRPRASAPRSAMTPARYVERVRVEAARRCLEDSAQPVDASRRRAASAPPRPCAAPSPRASASPRPTTAAASSPRTSRPEERHPCRSPSSSTTASPPSTPSAPTRSSPASPAPTSTSSPTEPGPVRTDSGTLAMVADAPLATYPHPDIVVVPGGSGDARRRSTTSALLGWLREAARDTARGRRRCAPARCCWRAAGMLDGVEATTHWLALDELARARRRADRATAWSSAARS